MRHEEVFDKAVDFLRNIKSTDNVVVIFNNDGDGICSCILINKYLETKKNKPYIISQPMPTEKNLIRKVQTTVPTKIIILDIAIDQQQNVLKNLAGMCDILVIDHHQISRDMNSDSIVHYNPRFEKPGIYKSTSYCAYKICSALHDTGEFLWIAAVGMVSDYNLDFSQDLVKESVKKYSLKSDILYETHFGRLADMISAAKAMKALMCEEMVWLFNSMKGPEDFSVKGSDKLVESFKTIENEMMSIMADAEQNSEKDGKILFYNIKSRYNLASPVSTKLSEKHLDKLVLVYEKTGNRIKVSGRNQAKKFDVGRILQTATRGLKASGGGHDAAGGATLETKDWEKFKERLEEITG